MFDDAFLSDGRNDPADAVEEVTHAQTARLRRSR